MDYSSEKLSEIILEYRKILHGKIVERELEMKSDNNEHYILYNALGVSDDEGYSIDFQQNVGRFLYKYAGSLIEELAITCFKLAFPDKAKEKVRILNTIDRSPKTVEIDCLIGNKAIEIKWKDATTDGDHIKKEEKRVRVIKEAGYCPIRIMFFKPNRKQAIKIQEKLYELYCSVGGEYYSGEAAWEYLQSNTGIDLKTILERHGID